MIENGENNLIGNIEDLENINLDKVDEGAGFGDGEIPKQDVPNKEHISDEKKKEEELIKLQQDFINEKRDIFNQISKTSNLEIKPGNGFRIIFDKPIHIELDAKDWEEMLEGKFTEEEMIWSTMHEIAHFIDMLDDPIASKENFEYMKNKAENLVPKARKIWSESLEKKGEKLPEFVTDDYLKSFLYGKIHGLYNCLDDVYVNNLVGVKLPGRYLRNRGNRAVIIEKLYSDYLFKKNDLTENAKSSQLGYAIIRRYMTPNSKTTISPEVEKALNEKKNIGGKMQSISEMIKVLLVPSSQVAKIKNTPNYRYKLIKAFIEPEFWKLFWQDLENFPPPKKSSGKGKGGEGGEGGGTENPPSVENEFEIGTKVRDNKTGKIGTIIAENDDGSVEVNFSEEEVKLSSENESVKKYFNPKEELTIIKPGKPPKGKKKDENSDGPKVEYEEKPDENEEDGEQGENESENDPWEEINKPNPLGEKEIDDFLESKKTYSETHQEPEKPIEEKLTPAEILEKAKGAKIKYDANIAETYGKLSPLKADEVTNEWHKYSESVKPYVNDISKVFDNILNTIQKQISEAWEKGFKTGRFNVQHFIKKYAPSLVAGSETENIAEYIRFNEIDTFDQREFISRLKIYPNNICVRLIIDKSGSMQGEKNIASKQLMVLLYEALKSFEARVNHNFRLSKEPFRVDLEVQAFSDDTVLCKQLGFHGEEEKGMMIASLAHLYANGSTRDSQSWENILAEFNQNPAWQKQIKNGERMDIAFEITDGDSETPVKTKQEIREYLSFAGKGSASGIKIVNKDETKDEYEDSVFNKIFQDNGKSVRHPKELAGVVTDLLKEKFDELQDKMHVGFESSADFEE